MTISLICKKMLKLNKNVWVLKCTTHIPVLPWAFSACHAIFYGSSRNYIMKLRDQRNEAFYAQSPAVQLLKMLKGSEVFNEVLHKLLVSRVTQFSTMASKRRYYDRQTSEKRFTFLLTLEAVFSCQIF